MTIEIPDWINAARAYEVFGVPRSVLRSLADAGRVAMREVETECGRLFLYSSADINKIINGATDGASDDGSVASPRGVTDGGRDSDVSVGGRSHDQSVAGPRGGRSQGGFVR